MGILDRLKQLATTPEAKSHSPNGSEYAPNYVVNNPYPQNPLSTISSSLHADREGNPGYSLNGAGLSEVQKLYNEYDDGSTYTLPPSSDLDNPQATYYTDLQTGDKVTVLYTSKNKYLDSIKEKTNIFINKKY